MWASANISKVEKGDKNAPIQGNQFLEGQSVYGLGEDIRLKDAYRR